MLFEKRNYPFETASLNGDLAHVANVRLCAFKAYIYSLHPIKKAGAFLINSDEGRAILRTLTTYAQQGDGKLMQDSYLNI